MAKITKANSPSPAMVDDHRKYEARDALRTLTRAAEIRKDAALMRDVKKEAKAQIKSVGSVLTKPRKA